MREELLYPIQVNDSPIGKSQPEIILAAYLINFKEFEKTNVTIMKRLTKERFIKNICEQNYDINTQPWQTANFEF